MAVYKFRVTYEDDTDVYRDIEIESEQTFLDFHKAILSSINFRDGELASFYMSDDSWRKGKEITLMDMNEDDTIAPIKEMQNSQIADYIEDPHQKMIFVYDFMKMWTFNIELIKILPKAEAKATYPRTVKSEGEAPKQVKSIIPPVLGEDDEVDDKKNSIKKSFSELEEYGVDSTDEDDELLGEEGEEEATEEDEFGGSFSEEMGNSHDE
jgi:hypothetical protein